MVAAAGVMEVTAGAQGADVVALEAVAVAAAVVTKVVVGGFGVTPAVVDDTHRAPLEH